MDLDRLTRILRCPHCAARRRGGKLTAPSPDWLVCSEPGCGRRYPIEAGLPIMLTDDGDFLGYRRRTLQAREANADGN